MNTFKIKTNSWHYRMLKIFHDDWLIQNRKDFCSYWRMWFFTALVAGILSIIAAIIATGAIIAAFTHPGEVAGGALFVIGIFTFVFAIFVGIEKTKEKINNTTEAEAGLILTKYRAFKGKYCPKVEFE